MNKNNIFGLILFCIISIFSIRGVDVYAEDSFCGEGKTSMGKYTTDEYDDYNADLDFSVKKTGLYKLTTKIDMDCRYTMSVYSSKDYEIWSDNDWSDNEDAVCCDAIYLETGEKYRINVHVDYYDDDIIDSEVIFESKFIKNIDLNPEADFTFIDEYNKEYTGTYIMEKGVSWNYKTQTLTLKKSNVEGNFYFRKVIKDYSYDDSKYLPKVCIKVIGKNTITSYSYKDVIEGLEVDLVLKGKGTLNIKKRLNPDCEIYNAISLYNFGSLEISNIKLNIDSYGEGLCADNIKLNNVKASFKVHNTFSFGRKDSEIVYYRAINAYDNVSINNSNISFKLDFLEKKYETKKYNDMIHSTLIKAKGGSVTDSTLNVDASKYISSKFKKGKLKVVDKSIDRSNSPITINGINSYRNGLKKGSEMEVDGLVYKVLKPASTDKKYVGELVCCGHNNIAEGKVSIPDKITDCACEYKVVRIGKIKFARARNTISSFTIGKNVRVIDKKAFAKCKKLSKVIIKSKSIKKIGKKAFVRKGNKKITFVVPKGMKKKYANLLKKAKVKNFVVVEK